MQLSSELTKNSSTCMCPGFKEGLCLHPMKDLVLLTHQKPLLSDTHISRVHTYIAVSTYVPQSDIKVIFILRYTLFQKCLHFKGIFGNN